MQVDVGRPRPALRIPSRARLGRWAWWATNGVVLAMVVLATVTAINELRAERGHAAIVPLLSAVGVVVVQVVLLGLAWVLLLQRTDARLRGAWALPARSFLFGWFARYVPGPQTGPAGKYVVLWRGGASRAGVGSALAWEQSVQLSVGILIPAALAGFAVGLHAVWLTPLGVLLAAGFALLPTTAAAQRRLRWLLRRLGATDDTHVQPLCVRDLLAPLLVYLVASALAGVAFHWIAVAVADWPAHDLGRSSFVFTTASLVGVFVPVPSGAGIREGLIVAIMGPIVGAGPALSAAVMTRAAMVLVDVVIGSAWVAGSSALVLRRRWTGAVAEA